MPKLESKTKSRYASMVKKSTPMTNKIWLFATVLVVVLVGVVQCQGHNEPSCLPDDQGDCTNTSNMVKTKKATLSDLFEIACTQTELAKCVMEDLDIDDDRRIIRAKRDIPKHGLLLGIPNELQIRLLDALKDPRIKSIYEAHPKLPLTGKLPSSKTYLAIYLVLESMRLRTVGDEKSLSAKERVHRAYFDTLPTLDDFLQFHPVAKKVFEVFNDDSDESKKEKLPKPTRFVPFVDQNTENRSTMILHEFKAFFEAIENFEDLVSFEDYVWARLVFETRAFSHKVTEDDIDDDEMMYYFDYLLEDQREDWGSDLRPLFDAFNDHNQMNLGWMEDFQQSTLDEPMAVVYGWDKIKSGTELFMSYGDASDFAKLSQYGFVNIDGSEHSLATLAPYHRPYTADPEEKDDIFIALQKIRMYKYLNFMDGYEICPKPDVKEGSIDLNGRTSGDKNEMLFQYSRMKALKSIFNRASFWGMSMPLSVDEGISDVTEQVLTTCRILAMTDRDYDGLALPLLGKLALDPGAPALNPSNNDALEYRTYHVLERLATEVTTGIRVMLASLITTDVDGDDVDTDVRRQLDSTELDPFSADGMKAYILLREIDALKMVIALARDKKNFYLDSKHKKLGNGEEVNEEDYIVRMEPCPEDP